MILYPNAKINIGLNIIKKRTDGFHELETVMYPIDLADVLTINFSNGSKKGATFSATGIKIDGDPNDNLIVKAYNIINSKCNLPALNIHLHKSIPFGAGLGGGSSDCAFTIKGINNLCKLNMTIKEMEQIAAELGSDCPYFIRNQPALAKGRGEILSTLKIDLNKYHFAVIIPPIPISTKLAYSKVTPQIPENSLSKTISSDIEKWKYLIKNDFETSVFPEFPEIQKIKDELYSQGAIYAALSGSGSAVFGIFTERIDASSIFSEEYFVWIK